MFPSLLYRAYDLYKRQVYFCVISTCEKLSGSSVIVGSRRQVMRYIASIHDHVKVIVKSMQPVFHSGIRPGGFAPPPSARASGWAPPREM
jgi:hypothetical protein